MSDDWDPNVLFKPCEQEFRLWLDDRGHRFVVVDEIDYHWAVKWRWAAKPDKHGNKFYAYRTFNGVGGVRKSLFLHVEILKRYKPVRPSPAHVIGDHRDGYEWNCRRKNLRWATASMNRRNIRGACPDDLAEAAYA